MFNALVITKPESGYRCDLTELDEAQLPAAGDVTVRVDYSTVNYKDGLALTNKAPVVRQWPMVPGIDGAGVVVASAHPDWRAGDRFGLTCGDWRGGAVRLGRCVHGDTAATAP